MTTAEIAAEIARHEDRIVELKADLCDLDERRAVVLAEREDEEKTIATLRAVHTVMESEERQVAEVVARTTRRRASAPEEG